MLGRALLLVFLALCQQRGASALSVGDPGGMNGGGRSSVVSGSGAANDINHQLAVGKFLPEGISRADKLRAFLECRKECIAKCDRLVYVYSTKKEFCHDCIRQCMIAVLQQARSLGIEFSSNEERMQGDSPGADSRAAPSSDEERRRRRRRNKLRNRDKKDRRERRQRKRQLEQQKLLKNCIVH